MFFPVYGYNGYHMMDMEFGNWFYTTLGIGVIILLTIILTYILIHYNNDSNSKSQLKNEINESNVRKANITDIEENDSRGANFYHNCGQKLDDKSVKFCPYCGEEYNLR